MLEIGFVDDQDVAGVYNLADCFVLPSFYEGFGIPILEAQASGCPVVCSSGGAMPEVAGDGALLFDPFRVEALRHALDAERVPHLEGAELPVESPAHGAVDLHDVVGDFRFCRICVFRQYDHAPFLYFRFF